MNGPRSNLWAKRPAMRSARTRARASEPLQIFHRLVDGGLVGRWSALQRLCLQPSRGRGRGAPAARSVSSSERSASTSGRRLEPPLVGLRRAKVHQHCEVGPTAARPVPGGEVDDEVPAFDVLDRILVRAYGDVAAAAFVDDSSSLGHDPRLHRIPRAGGGAADPGRIERGTATWGEPTRKRWKSVRFTWARALQSV